MLKLTRKPGQSIRIGDDIEIFILPGGPIDEWPRPIRIGIEAPREVVVLRKELGGKCRRPRVDQSDEPSDKEPVEAP
jgi:carbon storage regulator CsrA